MTEVEFEVWNFSSVLKFLTILFGQVSLSGSVVRDIINIDDAERTLARGLFNSVSGKSHDAGNDEKGAAILP